jgi:alkanesulfonate monooxygenase SsuD/methylene tetrahydromethanopterin reductase-like flavin-dependent oxidoreductase (luciferase family)
MRLGINLPFRQADGSAPTVKQLMERARLIERLGFDGIWVGDTVGRWPFTSVDSLAFLLAAAAGTERIELGTAIIQVPLRYPVELANRLITLYALSGKRFSVGVGSGSLSADFEAVGVDHRQRFRLLAEGVPILQRLFRGERVGAAELHPWPDVVGGPPILIAAWHNGTWLRRAAQEYDGWIASANNTSFTAFREGIQRFRDAGGKRAMVATIGVNLEAPSTPFKEDERFHLNCGPAEAAERLQRVAELGFDDVLVSRLNYSDADLPEADLMAIRALVPRDDRSPARTASASATT